MNKVLGFAYSHGTNPAPCCHDCFINVFFEVMLVLVEIIFTVVLVVVFAVDLFTEVMGKLGFGLLLFLLPAVLTAEPCRDQDGER